MRDYPSAEDEAPGTPGTTIVQIYFVGYFEGKPSWSDVRLFHRNQVLAFPMIKSPRVVPGQLESSGSDVVRTFHIKQTIHDSPRTGEFLQKGNKIWHWLKLSRSREIISEPV
jgi:hypothetical protein